MIPVIGNDDLFLVPVNTHYINFHLYHIIAIFRVLFTDCRKWIRKEEMYLANWRSLRFYWVHIA